jgi:hypothetical protein
MGARCSRRAVLGTVLDEDGIAYDDEPLSQQTFDLNFANGPPREGAAYLSGLPTYSLSTPIPVRRRGTPPSAPAAAGASRGPSLSDYAQRAFHSLRSPAAAFGSHTPGFPGPSISTLQQLMEGLSARVEGCVTWCRSMEWTHVMLAWVFTLLVVSLLLYAALDHTRTWATLPGRHGVTLFYELLMCGQRQVPVHLGAADADAMMLSRSARTHGVCSLNFSAPQEELTRHYIHERHTLDVMLRLEDGYQLGGAYLPVVVLGSGDYALVSFTIIDALRRLVYTPVTLQLGPDEDYPWTTNASRAGERADDVRWMDDLLHDFGEDLLEDLADDIGDIAENVVEDVGDLAQDAVDNVGDLAENVVEDALDPLDPDGNRTEAMEEAAERAEEEREEAAELAAEMREEAAERAEEALEEAQEKAAEEEEEEEEEAKEAGLLEDTERRRGFSKYVGKVALCALRARKDCDYFLHERMSAHVSVPEQYYDLSTPPFYYGPRAVLARTPILTATANHYGVYSRAKRVCVGVSCANVSVHRPVWDSDRYELVPAAALLAPRARVRWPLQVRIERAVVFSRNTSRPVQKPLLSFAQMGFEPDYTAYSDRNREAELERFYERRGGNLLVASFLLVAIGALSYFGCSKATKVIVASNHGSYEETPPSSPDPSPMGFRWGGGSGRADPPQESPPTNNLGQRGSLPLTAATPAAAGAGAPHHGNTSQVTELL